MRSLLIFILFVICSILWLNMDCQESLPQYSEPDSIYSLILRADQPDLDFVQRSIDEINMGRGGFGFNMDVINIFDETLFGSVQDTLGELLIWWEEDPSIQATLYLTPFHEIVTHELDDPHFVFFNPGDSIRLAIVWKYWKDNRGLNMWNYTNSTYLEGTIFYGPMEFVAQSRVQLFSETSDVYSNQVSFQVMFYKNQDP